MIPRCRCLLLLLAPASLAVLLTFAAPAAEQPARSGPPRLAVLVVFDQFRGDYLTRWEGLFGEGGFRRLMKDGAWFQDCHYPYATTVTGAGHASLGTGSYPSKHGIVENDWYDRAAGEVVNCVGSDRFARVPPPEADSDKKPGRKKPKGASPERLLLPALGDAFKDATGGQGVVVSLSFKDRSAILPAGRKADACYWAEDALFVTSAYYRDKVHPWVEEFNRGKPADKWFGKDWARLRPDLDYEKYSGPDDVDGEAKGTGQGRTFPHPMTGGQKALGKDYYKAVYNSPFGNELLLDLAKRAIDAEKLGSRDVPDLLCVSFSSNDVIGHTWGPDSQEVLDVTLRSDLIVKELLAYLDAKVGKGRYVLVLSADHGVVPLPEVSRAKGRDAARIAPAKLKDGAVQFLDDKFGPHKDKAGWFEQTERPEDVLYPWVYLNRKALRDRGLKQGEVEEALAGWLRKQPGIQAAYTRTQILGDLPKDDELARRVRLSFHPERSGDIALVVKPYYYLSSYLTGTGHSTPHSYDTHVPLLVYGAGVRAGVRHDAVTPQAAAAILARAVGIKPPAGAEAPVPEKLFTGP